jgi:hypothetical protein
MLTRALTCCCELNRGLTTYDGTESSRRIARIR